MTARNTSKENWDASGPVTSDNAGDGADEIRYLRLATEDRLNKEHVEVAGSGAGGEHLEGSARIHTATSAPTNMVVGAKDTDGNAADVTIAGNEALCEGMIWADTANGFVMQVYAASAWNDVQYLKLAGGTVTGAVTFNGAITLNNSITGTLEGGEVVSLTKSEINSSQPAIKITMGANTNRTCIDLVMNSSSEPHILMQGDPTGWSNDGGFGFNGTNLEIRVGTTTFDVAMSAGTTGGTGSAGAGKQYVELNIGGTTYKVLHDGTV